MTKHNRLHMHISWFLHVTSLKTQSNFSKKVLKPSNFSANYLKIWTNWKLSSFFDKVSWNTWDPGSMLNLSMQPVDSQTRDLSETQFTVIFWGALAWCINIVPNVPIHHQAAGGFRVCSDQICTQRWWEACWFCCRKVQIQLFVTSTFHRGGRGGMMYGIEMMQRAQKLRTARFIFRHKTAGVIFTHTRGSTLV